MSLIPSRKHNSCPICDNTSGKCRQGREDQDYWQCMTYADANKGDIISGYKCLGQLNNGLWGQFRIDNSQEWSEQQRLEWKQRNQQRQQQQAKEDEARRQRSLSAAERDRQYLQLLGSLTLHPGDRADLVRRGFTHKQIELSGFKSVESYQKLQSKFSALLPGVGATGQHLLIKHSGYLCPIRNVDGLIVACQVRLLAIPTDDTNRYRWLSSGKNQTLHLYPEGAVDGELPLAVFRPQGKPEGIALAEGTGAKPFLVSQRLNQVVIGASGGQWASSEITFKRTLNQLSIELGGIKEITLHPDAGDICNQGVISRWRRVVALLKKWEWGVRFSWWNQLTKECADIDELPDLSVIKYITPDDFWKIANQATNRAEQEIEATPAANEQGIKFKRLRSSAFPELESEVGKDWLKMRKYTPDHVVNAKYFDWPSEQPGTHLAVRSNLGTGKTHHVHTKFLADDNLGANTFGYRNSLLIQFTERGKNWYHLQSDLRESKDDLSLVADPNSRIAACFDSLLYFQPHHFEGKRLVLDEIEGSFKHLYQSQTAVSFRRQLCKDRAGEAINNSEAVMLLDGNLTDLTVAHTERISGKKFTKVENLYKGNRGKVTFYTGTLKFGKDEKTGKTIVTERRINDYSLLHQMMVGDREPFVCGSDSQQKLEAWHEILRLKGRKVFRLDSSNSNTPEAKKFLAAPAKYIQENGIEIILYSPTAESGLSIDLKGYFKRCYYFFFGVVQTNEQTQFLGRLRDPDSHIHVFCQNQGIDTGKSEQTATQIQEACLDYALACSQISLADVSEAEKQRLLKEQAAKLVERSNDPHFQYECHLKAKEIFERNHLRKCLEYALRSAGYQVEVVAGFKVSQEDLEAAKKAVQVRKSQEIFSAQPLTDSEASDVARKFNATQQEKTEVTRHRLLSRLPGIENKTFTTSKVVTLPQAAFEEIKSGRVSLETAQKLGIPTPEMPTPQRLDQEHLPPNISKNQSEGVPASEEADFNDNGGVLASDAVDSLQNQTPQIQGVASPEIPTTQAIDLEHLPLSFSINQGEGVPPAEGGEVEVVVTETLPIFDPDFIRKVKYQDRAWISRVELHFLLQHPDIAKLLQQKRWYKKLQIFTDPNQPDCTKRINLSTYKSDWLKIHTLLEMGIEFFLNPASRWTQDSPEVLEFWEKGKDTRRARYIGSEVGDSKPCEYIGRILNKLDVKRKTKQIKNEAGEKVRVYRVDADYLSSPRRSAVFESIQTRIEKAVFESEPAVVDWDAIVEKVWANEAAQNPDILKPEILTPQALEMEHLPLNYLNNQGEGVPLQELVEAFSFCETRQHFAAVIEGYSQGDIEDAIALADTQPMRLQLAKWWEETLAATQVSEEVESIKPGQRVRAWIAAFNRWGQGVISGVLEGVSWDVRLEGECLEILKIFNKNEIELIPPT